MGSLNGTEIIELLQLVQVHFMASCTQKWPRM